MTQRCSGIKHAAVIVVMAWGFEFVLKEAFVRRVKSSPYHCSSLLSDLLPPLLIKERRRVRESLIKERRARARASRQQQLASEQREDQGAQAMSIIPYGGGVGGSLP